MTPGSIRGRPDRPRRCGRYPARACRSTVVGLRVQAPQGWLVIETVDEKQGGPFAGLHACYVLQSPVALIERVAA
jgi:hypothetical protein